MFKLRGPENCTSASHAGIIYKSNKNGIFTVAEEAVNDLTKHHGFKIISEEDNSLEDDKPEKLEKVKKSQDLEDL